ncbi:MAG: hypothetical protein ACKOD9_17095 [Rubrivivax sp.]
MALSVPLLFEYEEVLSRPGIVPVSSASVQAVLDMMCKLAIHHASTFFGGPGCVTPMTRWCWWWQRLLVPVTS